MGIYEDLDRYTKYSFGIIKERCDLSDKSFTKAKMKDVIFDSRIFNNTKLLKGFFN